MNRKSKKLGLILLGTLGIATVAYAAGVPQKFGHTDILQFGRTTSTDLKELIFDTGDGATNRRLTVPDAGSQMNSSANTFQVGDGVASDKQLTFDRGGSNAFLKWDEGTSRLVFSNDGTLERAIGSGAGGGGGINIMANPQLEDGVVNYTASGASTFVELSGGTQLVGEKSGRWDPSTTGEFLTADAQTIPVGLRGAQCVVKTLYLWDSGTIGHIKFQAYDGTNVLAEGDIEPTSGVAREAFLIFTCPTSGNISWRMESTADAAAVDIDENHTGSNIREVNVASAEIFGTAVWSAVGSPACSWTGNPSVFADPPVDSDCPDPTVTGRVAAPATKQPKILIPVLPPGKYEVIFNVNFGSATTGSEQNSIRVVDESNNPGSDGMIGNANRETGEVFGVDNTIPIGGVFIVNTARTNAEFKIQWKKNQGTADMVLNSDAENNRQLSVVVRRYPLDSEKAQTIDIIGWKIDANIGGASPDLGGFDQSSYGPIANGSLDLVLNPGSQPAQIGCAAGTAPSGLTCSAADEHISIAFTPLRAGSYEVCFEITHQVAVNNGEIVNASFQAVETPLTAITIDQEGNGRRNSRFDKSGAEAIVATNTIDVCGEFTFNDVSQQKLVRLMYEQDVTGTISTNVISASRTASVGQPDIRVTVRPTAQTIAAAVIGESVVVPGQSGATKIFAAEVEFTGGTPSLIAEVGSWVDSITDIGVGVVQLNFIANTWTVSPTCTCTSQDNATGFKACFVTDDVEPNASAMRFSNFVASTGTATDDGGIHIHCIGQ